MSNRFSKSLYFVYFVDHGQVHPHISSHRSRVRGFLRSPFQLFFSKKSVPCACNLFFSDTCHFAAIGYLGLLISSRAQVWVFGACAALQVISCFSVYVGGTCVCLIAAALWRFQNQMSGSALFQCPIPNIPNSRLGAACMSTTYRA
jgi:hypothetical protein